MSAAIAATKKYKLSGAEGNDYMRMGLVVCLCFLLTACGGQSKEELLQEGNRLNDNGNFRGAIVLYKNALEQDGNYLEARRGLAETYFSLGSFARAEKEFQEILLQNPSATDVHLRLTAVLLQQKKPELAIESLEKYHSSQQESADSLSLYGRAVGAKGDLETAENYFRKALQLDVKAIQPRLNLAKVFLKKNNYSQAKSYLEEVISAAPRNIEAYYVLASIESRLGQPEVALKVYQNLVKVRPGEIHAHYMSGLIHIELDNVDAAMRSVESIFSIYPERAEGYRLKGILLYKQQKFAEAKVALETSLKNERHLLAYFFLGLSDYGLGQYEQALNQFQGALDLNPAFERARVLVAMTLLKQKRVDDAVVEIQKVLRANPDNAYAHNILGSALLSLGQYDEGMTELQQATNLDPTLADAHLKRGLFRLASGQGARGESDLLQAVEAAPEILNSRLMLVTHYLREGNYTATIKVLQEGLDGSKSDALLNNYLAAAFFSQKNISGAIAALQQAKQIDPAYLTPYFNLAAYYASQSEYDKAITEYQQIVTQDSSNLKALLGMASLYRLQERNDEVLNSYQRIEATKLEDGFVAVAKYYASLNDYQKALDACDRGLELYNSSLSLIEFKGELHWRLKQLAKTESAFVRLAGLDLERGHSLLVRFYLESGQEAKAEKLVDRLLTSHFEDAYAYILASRLALLKNDSDAAVAILEKGLKTLNRSIRLRMQLAQVYEGSGKTDQAALIYRQVVKQNPRFAPGYTALGRIREQLGTKAEALELYRTALGYDQNNVAALNNLAYLLLDNYDQTEEALNFAKRAYRLRSGDPRIMDTLGYALLKNKQLDEAVGVLSKASELMPDVQAIKLHLAMAKRDLGRTDEARQLLGQVVAGGSQDEIRQANAILESL